MKIIYKPETKTFIMHEVTLQEFRIIKNVMRVAISELYEIPKEDKSKTVELSNQLQEVVIGYL